MKNIGIIFLLIILPFFFYLEFASSKSMFSQKDWLVRSFPLKKEAVSMLKHRILPLWNPYMLCGSPLFANIDIAPLYPLYIFDFLIPVEDAVRWNFLLHISMGGVFMYIFLRVLGCTYFGALFGTITFMFGGYMQSFMPHPMLWVTTMYIPLIFLLFELGLQKENKRYVILGGISLALQILSGVPQIVYYTLLALLLYGIFYPLGKRYVIRYLFLLVFIGFALSSFQLLPTYEYYLQSAKYHFQVSQEPSHLMPMLPHTILFFIGVASPYTSGFIGISGLLFALFAPCLRRDRVSVFFGILCLLVLASVLEITKIYKILFHIPGFNMFNSLHRFVSIYAFGISVLAGLGASAVTHIVDSENKKAVKIISMVLSLVLLMLISAFLMDYFLGDHIINYGKRFIKDKVFARPGHPFSLEYYYEKLEYLYSASLNILKLSVLPVIGVLCLIIFRRKRFITRTLFQTGIVCIVLVELFGYWNRLGLELVDPTIYYRESKAVSFIKKDTSIYRAFGLDATKRYHFDFKNSRKINDLLTPNLATTYHIQDPQGMNNFNLWNYWQMLNLLNNKKNPLEGVYSRDPFHLLAIVNPNHNLIDLLNIKYMLSYSPIKEDDRWELVFDNGIKVYENKKVIPRVFIAYDYKVAQNESERLNLLNDPDIDLRNTVILERHIGDIGPASPNNIDIVKYSPMEIEIEAYTESPGILVLSDTFYPGWYARIDGRREKILRAYSVFRAVPIPGGRHHIVFRYFPISFIAGAVIGIMTFTVIVLEGVRSLFRF